jgi:hypothetical protein
VEALGVELEVMDQRFHRGLHLAARGGVILPLASMSGPTGSLAMHCLMIGRLAHLLHAAEIAVIAVAVLADRNLELELVVALIGLRTAQVPGRPDPRTITPESPSPAPARSRRRYRRCAA